MQQNYGICNITDDTEQKQSFDAKPIYQPAQGYWHKYGYQAKRSHNKSNGRRAGSHFISQQGDKRENNAVAGEM